MVYGARLNGYKGDLDELVETSLRRAALWEEVKDKLKESGFSLSGGQQQRLCIARAIAAQPEVLLMDEPCSALDPISTLKVEELMHELKERYTIIIVTHNMQQATRVIQRVTFSERDNEIQSENATSTSQPNEWRMPDKINLVAIFLFLKSMARDPPINPNPTIVIFILDRLLL